MAKARQDPDSTLGLADRLHSVAIRLLRRARREDAAMGLPPAQASVLSVLVFGGARTLSALADVEQVKAPTMTRIVDALERAGLAQRQPDADDRRKLSIAATASGVRLMQKGRSRRVNALAQLLADLDRDERAVLEEAIALLARLQTRKSGQ
ncbi:MAG TPA: MarR family transcriptional regulator [Rudaea sp.]|jgi:DNA-binding MarR family transcriptional regulator|nr:MarR family transcriptional regulator [Rudaea sp.]HSC12426.1 MarR family transcriptional regulator [Rhodanobacteraceae bacterium]